VHHLMMRIAKRRNHHRTIVDLAFQVKKHHDILKTRVYAISQRCKSRRASEPRRRGRSRSKPTASPWQRGIWSPPAFATIGYIHRNPLRAGIVERLSDYKWSSYRYYAYGKSTPSWLKTGSILAQMNAKIKNLAYRRKVQKYADEKGSVWEDVRYGLAFGSEAFLNDLRKRFLSNHKNVELPSTTGCIEMLILKNF